ncbi:hypothetical protein X963_5685 [Burkholderia pseudomallei MSHR7498]|nr:hypothetical protein X963_5685 [Burkholderia pseudomallei MSHR7498]
MLIAYRRAMADCRLRSNADRRRSKGIGLGFEESLHTVIQAANSNSLSARPNAA